jgi:hypothetical protein
MKIEAQRQLRNHFTIKLAAKMMKGKDIEYYVKGKTSANTELFFPSTAPERNITVIKLSESISQF